MAEKLTPQLIANRPGLSALAYRVGTHAAFLEAMKARLSNYFLDVPQEGSDEQGRPRVERLYPLHGLTTRAADDPAIALLDAWAMVGDVLTFYQERIANEGYLRTATERRSILELARLVGYTPRPGVASTVFLAYTLDNNFKEEVIIPAGARSQSVPGPGELPQSFETSDPLPARSAWNALKPRLTRPQTERSIRCARHPRVYLKGVSTNLHPNDPLLIDFTPKEDPSAPREKEPVLYRVLAVKPDPAANHTLVTLQYWSDEPADHETVCPEADDHAGSAGNPKDNLFHSMFDGLTKARSVPPVNARQLPRNAAAAFQSAADAGLQMVGAFRKDLNKALPAAMAHAKVTPDVAIKVYAFRAKAAPFGHNAQKRLSFPAAGEEVTVIGEWPIVERKGSGRINHEDAHVLYLDASYDRILSGSWLVIDMSVTQLYPQGQVTRAWPYVITTVSQSQANITRNEYGISGQTTRLTLEDPWINIPPIALSPPPGIPSHGTVPEAARSPAPFPDQATADKDFQVLRGTIVYAQQEELLLAEEPILDPICGGAGGTINTWLELGELYNELQPGRWLIVSGERTDIQTTDPADRKRTVQVTGIKSSELVMLSEVVHRPSQADDPLSVPGERIHTFIRLARQLEFCYRRDTVTIYGNVVKATHGETRNEVLGSGDASQALQSFTLRQPPLTYVAASNPRGAASTLQVRVDDVEWHAAENLAELGPLDRRFILRTSDEGQTTVIFGNGQQGARLPTGSENIKAAYRNGLGKAGNVQDGQVSLLVTRPLGVREVVNPLGASGGADRENRDQARKNTPLALLALDRLVSIQDYADFARAFAGIGKASAARLSDGRRQLVYVTIAGADDIPIDKTSDLYRNLSKALRELGDPYLPIRVELRELMLIVLSANVRIQPDYQWEAVVPHIQARLLDAFSFENRELGQDVLLSEVISTIQSVAGVAYVDVDLLQGVPEKTKDDQNPGRRLLTPAEITARIKEALQDNTGQAVKKPLARLGVDLADFDESKTGRARTIHPAQLACLTPAVPATLILNQIT